jgi:hypothetical protein
MGLCRSHSLDETGRDRMFTTSRNALVSQRYVRTLVLASAALIVSTHAFADPLAVGAVESFDKKTSTISVLGQQYAIGTATLVAGTKSFPVSRVSWLAASNALVRIDGTRKPDGSVQATSVVVLPELNAPGSTEVFVSGVVTAVRSDGTVAIGKLSVDANSVGLDSVAVGDTIEVFGVQPSADGVLLAQNISSARGVGGTGKTQGVGGTGKAELKGVGGTGKAELLGVGGTGKLQGVGGTGKAELQGVGGTGKAELLGVGGTGKVELQGVGGTGKAELQGVGGTGKMALLGVGGTGKVQGVGGTGKAELQGVGGTGKAELLGVGGTGKLQGVGGTGKAELQGVGGTGKAELQGVGGTGKAEVLGVGGTGKAELQGVGGTGKAELQGVGGTGKTALLGVGGTGK